ncbi:hypothetical protein KY289_016614 [Solanum tuberosum]|nr:hypothetical protein KY289_016614 [Solanum tuberosum]
MSDEHNHKLVGEDAFRIGHAGANRPIPRVGNASFNFTNTILHLQGAKVSFGGLPLEESNKYVKDFVGQLHVLGSYWPGRNLHVDSWRGSFLQVCVSSLGMRLVTSKRSLDAVKKFMANNIVEGSLINHTYEEVSTLLDQMNMPSHAREADVVGSASIQTSSTKERLKEEAK